LGLLVEGVQVEKMISLILFLLGMDGRDEINGNGNGNGNGSVDGVCNDDLGVYRHDERERERDHDE